jgi:hypothetical protein
LGDVKLRWGFETAEELARALKFLTEEFAESKANKQTLGEVDSCCAGASTSPLAAEFESRQSFRSCCLFGAE